MDSNGLISIIVPIYKGIRHIQHIIEQIEQNAKQIKSEVELVMINDFPEENLPQYASDMIKIICVQSNINRGIHGARAEGLRYSSGEYVLFLDQDDYIKNNYLKSQMLSIGDRDASVCRVIHNRRFHYTDTFVFEKVISKEFMINNWCPIVSPGQVLLRRSSIPKEWEGNILKNNGADDYFLWILMMGQGKHFALNDEVLFEHIVDGNNTSGDNNKMMDSENEMIEILKRIQLFEKSEVQFEKLRTSLRRIHIKQLENQVFALNNLKAWYQSFCKMGYVYQWIKNNKSARIAIYGAGELGIGLRDFLAENGILITCYLDQNAAYIISDSKAYTMESCDLQLDSILLTIQNKELRNRLVSKFECEVIDVGNVLL